MKRFLLILVSLMLPVLLLRAQDTTATAPLDSTLVGRDILSVLGPDVQVDQTPAVLQALRAHVAANADKPIMGYRIRVFYDNDPSARTRSENIAATLRKQYPKTQVYLSFESPNYKVTVGDFRTKDEAQYLYNALKGAYPTAFLIKESINYPR